MVARAEEELRVAADGALRRERSTAARVIRRLERAAVPGALYVAAITPWEIAMLARAGKFRVNRSVLWPDCCYARH